MNLEKSGYWSQMQKERQKTLRRMKKQNAVKLSYKSLFLIVLTIALALPLAAFAVYPLYINLSFFVYEDAHFLPPLLINNTPMAKEFHMHFTATDCQPRGLICLSSFSDNHFRIQVSTDWFSPKSFFQIWTV